MISVPRLQAEKPGTAEVDPDVLADMIVRAVAFVESQTRRRFGPPAKTTEYLWGSGGRVLRLPEPIVVGEAPVVGLVSIEERPYPGGPETVVPLPEVSIRPGGTTHLLVRAAGWTREREYAVTYWTGYPVDTGPGDVRALVMGLVGVWVAKIERDGLSGESIGGYSYTMAATHAFEDGDLRAIPGAMRTIRAWQRLVVA